MNDDILWLRGYVGLGNEVKIAKINRTIRDITLKNTNKSWTFKVYIVGQYKLFLTRKGIGFNRCWRGHTYRSWEHALDCANACDMIVCQTKKITDEWATAIKEAILGDNYKCRVMSALALEEAAEKRIERAIKRKKNEPNSDGF